MNFTDPVYNLEKVPVLPGQVIADFGSGSGAYVLAAAKLVGPKGQVYAIDIIKELLERIQTEAGEKHLDNIEILQGDVEKVGGSKLADKSVDIVIISNLLFQVDSGFLLAGEAKRVLKSDGQVLVIDWLESFNNLGPSDDQVVDKVLAERIFAQAGFELKTSFAAGPHHYGLIFKKS